MLLRLTLIAVLLFAGAVVVAYVQTSGGTWMIRSAPLPEGWPELTPVGAVELRSYPPHRAAYVDESSVPRAGRGSMFMELFRHIERNDIAMTAPVEMGYADAAAPRMVSMGFLYRTPELGPAGADGRVEVRDVEPARFASTGVRGAYDAAAFARGRARLEDWLAQHGARWRATGPARFLAYNGPFVPWFLQYGEVQIPVEPRGDAGG